MKIAILRETDPGETRVAATPETVQKFIALGCDVVVESQLGHFSSGSDDDYQSAGAVVEKTRIDTIRGADLILKVRSPILSGHLSLLSKNGMVLGFLLPIDFQAIKTDYITHKITALSLDMVPRITRAQSMDALSSQTNLAGYRAVIEAVAIFDRILPMMMTAAGTLVPARVLVIGAGVAGLQAIATARRLGAIVSAFDVRDSAKEQVESLGATFVSVPANTDGENAGGYAREMDSDYQNRQKNSIAAAVLKSDIVITTALIPGKPAPRLITKSMIESMKPGSVIVDMAAESGGNCEGTIPGTITPIAGVQVLGYGHLASRIGRDATYLLSRNILKIVELLMAPGGANGSFNQSDDIIKAMTVTTSGSVVHPLFQN